MNASYKDSASTFKQNHITLATCLDDIAQSISASLVLTRQHYLSIKPLIRSLQQALFNHLQLQNQHFYERLKEQQRGAPNNLEFLEQDLKGYKIQALIFFDEHPADMGDLNPKNFKATFSEFSVKTVNRINVEKNFLLPLLANEA